VGQEVTALYAIVAAAVAILAAWIGGRRASKTKAKADELQDYKDTRERMDHAPDVVDADDARRRMRERKP
jgi:hypothetical protein